MSKTTKPALKRLINWYLSKFRDGFIRFAPFVIIFIILKAVLSMPLDISRWIVNQIKLLSAVRLDGIEWLITLFVFSLLMVIFGAITNNKFISNYVNSRLEKIRHKSLLTIIMEWQFKRSLGKGIVKYVAATNNRFKEVIEIVLVLEEIPYPSLGETLCRAYYMSPPFPAGGNLGYTLKSSLRPLNWTTQEAIAWYMSYGTSEKAIPIPEEIVRELLLPDYLK